MARVHSIKPFDDKRVRQALRHATDPDTVLKVAYRGLGKRGEHHHVAPAHPEYVNVGYMKQDIAKAKALLAEAGYPNGIDTEIICRPQPDWELLAVQAMVEQWKEPIAQRALDAGDMRGVVIAPGVAYGDGGGGVPGLLLGSPRDDDGNLIMLGSGRQHWATVHVADLADVFRRALENDSARGHYVIGDGLNPTVAEFTEAAAVAAGAPGAVPGSDEEARARLGDYFAEVLLLDQGTQAAKARADSVGPRPIRALSTSSATGATAPSRP